MSFMAFKIVFCLFFLMKRVKLNNIHRFCICILIFFKIKKTSLNRIYRFIV